MSDNEACRTCGYPRYHHGVDKRTCGAYVAPTPPAPGSGGEATLAQGAQSPVKATSPDDEVRSRLLAILRRHVLWHTGKAEWSGYGEGVALDAIMAELSALRAAQGEEKP